MPITLEDVYEKVPAIDCRRKCSRSCGVILAPSSLEAERCGARGEQVADGTGAMLTVFRTDHKGRCHLLRNGNCTVHPRRPLVCRLWGVVEAMPCLWGCVPERVLPDHEGRMLIHATLQLERAMRAQLPGPEWIRCLACGLEQPSEDALNHRETQPCLNPDCGSLYAVYAPPSGTGEL